ncbi:MAG: hypothetical protein JWN90_572 [Parcubacteria group bacterium]|nr:hypothetical protein [Parcubacteria group bacterium]
MSDSHGGGGLPGLGLIVKFEHTIHTNGYHLKGRPLVILFLILNFGFLFFSPSQTLANWSFVAFFSPLWVPYIASRATFVRFVQANRAQNIANQKYVLLELRMPRDTKKTPLAMEAILSGMHIDSGESSWYKRIVLGNMRPSFSLELVSIGGRVHFYIWMREGFRRATESFFYAQYPDMEIIEAEDYSLLFDPMDHANSMFGDEYKHGQPDPFPIKTYVDYGLDKAGAKPEEITDPLAQLIEFMGSIGPTEQLWIQFIMRYSKSEKYGNKKNEAGKPYTWTDEAKEVINTIRESTTRKTKYVDPTTGKEVVTEGFPNPSKGQSETMAAIDRNVAKQSFDVGIRAIYTAPQEAFQGSMISFFLSMFKPFNSESYNSIKTAARFSASFNDYPWEDRGGHLKHHLQEQIVEYYRRRVYFQEPYIGEWMIMSTEEIATLFHVPGANVETPSLPRIQSATSGAPANLPT